MYVCGPTVYDLPHIGHGRANLTFDVLRRYLSFTGLRVHHVSNVTDVDDNIIKRGVRARAHRARRGRRVRGPLVGVDGRAGGAAPARTSPTPRSTSRTWSRWSATWSARGMAYETPDGVYLEVSKVDGYGLLAQQPLESLQAGARVEANEDKRSPLDFALWKKAKEGEPSWESPWGPGRPGWHTECVVMSLDLLGEGFDLHGGGQDLMFPHHENERAQAVADGKAFARHWMHNGWVVVEGDEDVQVAGQLHVAARPAGPQRRPRLPPPGPARPLPLADRGDARDRSPTPRRRWPGSTGSPGASTSADLLARTPDGYVVEGIPPATDIDAAALGGVPGAHGRRPRHPRSTGRHLRAGHRGATRPPTPGDAGEAGRLAAHGGRAGRGTRPLAARAPTPRSTRSRRGLVAERDEARRTRDFARADALRDELTARGWTVEDTASGTAIRR